MKVNEILNALEHDRYVWTAKNPKQTLYVRIGKLIGVQKSPLEGCYTVTPDIALKAQSVAQDTGTSGVDFIPSAEESPASTPPATPESVVHEEPASHL